MKKLITRYLTLFITWCLLISNTVFAQNWVSVFIPQNWWASDYNPLDKRQIDGNYSLLDIIKFVNDYLWFAIWFVCFLFIVINWIKLISARWDEKATSSAMKALIGCVIWIVICLSAYIIVNVTIRLFS